MFRPVDRLLDPIIRFVATNMTSSLKQLGRKLASAFARHRRRDDEAPLHSPLCPGEFRLVELKPSTRNDSEIRLGLVTAHIDNPPSFLLLSYVWGNPVKKHILNCNGHDIGVLPGIHDFLHAMGPSNKSRLIWIDYICINQTDAEETKVQMTLLYQISLAAQRSIVWVGNENPEQQGVLDGVETEAAAAFEILLRLATARTEIFGDSPMPLRREAMADSKVQKYKTIVPPPDNIGWKSVNVFLGQNIFQR